MAQLMLINPRKRRSSAKRKAAPKRRKTRKYTVAKSNPVPALRRRRATSLKRVAKRRVRRNPIGTGGIIGMLTDAAIGGGGALAVNYAFDKLPIPITMKVGVAGLASKAGLAVLLGTVGKKFLGNTAGKMAAGALTVIAFDAMKGFMPVSAPILPQTAAGLGYYGAGVNAGMLGEYVNGGGSYDYASNSSNMGEYVY